MTQKKKLSGTGSSPPDRRSLNALPPVRRGWVALLTVVVLIGAWVLADDGIQRRAPHGGFHPPVPSLLVLGDDLPRFWTDGLKTDVYQQFSTHWTAPLEPIELHLRQTAGLRPTPSRWRFWLGRRFLATHTTEGWGICAYPGVALRLVSAAFRPDEEGIRRTRSHYFAWRDGFLIASSSRAYVAAALTGPSIPRTDSPHRPVVRMRTPGPPQAEISLYAEDNLPVRGRIAAALEPRTRPLTLPHAWPQPPLAQIAASSLTDMRILWTALSQIIPSEEPWTTAKEHTSSTVGQWNLGPLAPGYDRIVDECALALLDIEQLGLLPWPDVALIMRSPRAIRGPHPLEGWVEPLPRMPAEWNGQPGLRAFLLGDDLTLCLGRYERDWYVTSREPIMARLAGQTKPGDPIEAEVLVAMDWERLTVRAEQALLQAAEWELLPAMDAREFHGQWGPRMQAIRSLRELQLEGHADGPWLLFNGTLAREARHAP